MPLETDYTAMLQVRLIVAGPYLIIYKVYSWVVYIAASSNIVRFYKRAKWLIGVA